MLRFVQVPFTFARPSFDDEDDEWDLYFTTTISLVDVSSLDE